jgi:hypothetical protein
MLWLTASSMVQNSVFRNSSDIGVYVNSSSSVAIFVISGNNFVGVPRAIYYSASATAVASITGNAATDGLIGIEIGNRGGTLTLAYNNFSGQTQFGVKNNTPTAVIDAQNNWWGASTGPSGQGAGSGVSVSSGVVFSNWWTSANQDPVGVRNVIATRRGESYLVDIEYDLIGEAGKTYFVSLSISKTGGRPYATPPAPASLAGAVGSGIPEGIGKRIVWDAAAGGGAFPYTDQMRVEVTAILE